MGFKFVFHLVDDEDFLRKQKYLRKYGPERYDVYCSTVNWKDCKSKKPDKVDIPCFPQDYLMLSCTGKSLLDFFVFSFNRALIFNRFLYF